jgi:cyclopropane-fatty-acyl-phospholipid synthase
LLERRARSNIHARNSLGTDFYRHWLDASLTYSGALFAGDDHVSLEQAQIAKFERILQALRPQPGQSLLDIGCGWGGFARYAAANYGCRVHAITISSRQARWARQSVQEARLDHLVSVQRGDFREVQGRYDFVVSIEAYEMMGRAAWLPYFTAIAHALRPRGRALLQAQVLADDAGDHGAFIRRHVHPRARLAFWPVLEQHALRTGLRVRSVTFSGEDYVRTLQCWRRRFNDAWPQLVRVGLEPGFQKLWNFYLAYCEAGYRAGKTRLVRAEMERARQ